MLCSVPADITSRMQNTVWSKQIPLLLTSGTLAIGSSFRRFQDECGLCCNPRVMESVAVSPFNYADNCRCSFPDIPCVSAPSGITMRSQQKFCGFYIQQMVMRLCSLPHTQIYPLSTNGCYSKSPNFLTAQEPPADTAAIQEHPGAVLLATGAAWEGMDFPGDCVSLLIIPRLPFAFPDAIHEHEKRNYPALRDFIRSVIVPKCRSSSSRALGAPSARKRTPAWLPSWMSDAAPEAATGRRIGRAAGNADLDRGIRYSPVPLHRQAAELF